MVMNLEFAVLEVVMKFTFQEHVMPYTDRSFSTFQENVLSPSSGPKRPALRTCSTFLI